MFFFLMKPPQRDPCQTMFSSLLRWSGTFVEQMAAVHLLFRSGGRSVILHTSKKTIPTTSVPPVNSYARAFALLLKRFILSLRFRFSFSVLAGFVGSSVSSEVSRIFSSMSSSSSSSSSRSRLSILDRSSSSSLSSSGLVANSAASL